MLLILSLGSIDGIPWDVSMEAVEAILGKGEQGRGLTGVTILAYCDLRIQMFFEDDKFRGISFYYRSKKSWANWPPALRVELPPFTGEETSADLEACFAEMGLGWTSGYSDEDTTTYILAHGVQVVCGERGLDAIHVSNPA